MYCCHTCSSARLAGNTMALKTGHTDEAMATPDAAQHIGSLVSELALLARRHNLDALAYILDMARIEADEIAKPWSQHTRQGSRRSQRG
jgi:hypothetical protein